MTCERERKLTRLNRYETCSGARDMSRYNVTASSRKTMSRVERYSRFARVSAIALSWALVAACGGHDPIVSASHQAVSDDSPLPVPADTVVPPDVSSINQAVVDGLPGSSEVTPDGQSHYRVPLWVPPGRAGMQPQLSLEYA